MKNIECKNIIKFYRATKYGYGFLSNLYKKVIFFEEREFPSAEYAYQFAKFKDETVREWAMKAPKPHLLAILAHGLFSWDMVKDWNEIRVNRMYNVLQAKFSDRELMYKLLDTGDSILIEDSKSDAFWGIGKNQKGRNLLGKLLMKVREDIKKELRKINEENEFTDTIPLKMVGRVPIPREDYLPEFTQIDDVKDDDVKDRGSEVMRKL